MIALQSITLKRGEEKRIELANMILKWPGIYLPELFIEADVDLRERVLLPFVVVLALDGRALPIRAALQGVEDLDEGVVTLGVDAGVGQNATERVLLVQLHA